MWPKRSERRNNTKTTKMRTKSLQKIKISSQIKKPHLKMIPIKDKYLRVIDWYYKYLRVIDWYYKYLRR